MLPRRQLGALVLLTLMWGLNWPQWQDVAAAGLIVVAIASALLPRRTTVR